VPKTLLAVDDSATMRKVLEITFAGEDFRVVAAEGSSSALARMSEDPAAVVIDTTLGADDGYALAKDIRGRSARTAIVLLASRYAPYDPNRGRDAGADDFIDKPFDTQALIDKVKKAMLARESAARAAPPPPPPVVVPPPVQAPAPTTATAPMIAPPFGAAPRVPIAPVAAAKASFPTQRTHTLSFEGAPAAPSPAPPIVAPPPITRTAPSGMPIIQPHQPQAQPPAQAPTAQPPAQAPSAHTVPTAAPPRTPEAAPAAAAAVNGHLAGKLGDLGLTPAQVDAVLALSREVVERVVWEVVPQLAETIIKEEIARLTKEG
jgi:CheY-like chemotaxis protein